MTMMISASSSRFSQIAVFFTKLLVVFWVMRHVQAQGSNPVIQQSGYCSMYAICGQRSDGKVLNCANTTASVKPDDQLLRRIQSLCPTINGNVCCTADQFDTLRTSVQPAIPLLVGCPACLRNFLNLFCEMSCSSNQSLFINVNSITKGNSTDLVDGITYYITEAFSRTLYDSCKEVKFGSANSRAIDFIGNRARSYQEWFSFLGQKAVPGSIGSPYSISFITNASTSTGVSPMNATSYSCSDPSLGCSCGDCPSSPVCTKQQVPSTSSETHTCSVKIGKLEAQCVDLSMSIIFVVLACAILVWGFLKSKERKVPGTNLVVNSENKMETKETTQRPHSSVNDVNKVDTSNRDVHTGLNGQAVIGGNLVIGDVDLPFFQGLVLRFYRRYGIWVARYPVLILCSSVLVMALLCLGLMRFQVETRPEKLWVGPGSQADNEKQFFDSHLAPFYRIEQLIIATRPNSIGVAPSILTDENIQLLFEVQRQVDAIRGNYSGIAVSLADICLKPMGTDCATQSVLQYYQMNPANYTSLDHLQYCFQYYSSNPKCLSAFQGPVDPSTILGGFSGSNYSNATVFVVSYPVTNAVEVNGSENAKAIAWEEAFIRLAKGNLTSFVESKNLTLAFSSESSIQRELERESAADVLTIIISYIVMFVYISVTLGDAPRLSTIFISSKVVLGLSGVLLVMLSVLGSAGFFSAIGVKSTLIIMEVIPFLVLAVGVDNMCILVHAVKRQSKVLSIEERVSIALGEVGSSITLASLSEVLAFAVGSFIPMPAVRVFSMFAALAVLFDFFLQITAFTSLIVLDARRAESHRVDCFPCIKMPLPSGSDADGSPKGPGILQRYMRDVHAPILSFLGVKIAVLAIFVGFFFASIALCTRLDPGLEQQIALPRDSYLQGYFSNISEYLRVGPPVYFVVKNYNYSLEAGQTNKLCSINQCNSDSLLNQISRASTEPQSTYIAKPAASWLDDFLVWISPEAFSCCREFSNGNYCPPDDQPLCGIGDGDACKNCTTCFLSTDLVNGRPVSTQFKEKLPWFLDALPSADCAKGGHGAYTTSIDLKGYEDGVIRASEFRSYHTPLNKQVDFVNALKAARAFTASISKSLNIDVFPYSVFYIFFEQYLDIWKTALIGIFVGLGAVFVVCLAFTSSFWTSAIILCVLAMVVLDLMGVMALLHVQLNAISVVNIIMSIGIAVEFCVHLTHSFVVHKGDREHRIREALGKMGASVFSGITLTKLVGVVVLGFARSQIFVIYYFQVYLALVLIGALHGLVFLPVLLSICGPPSRQENCVPPQEGRPGATR